MPSYTLTAVAAAAISLFASTASSHLIMQKPVPFGVDSLDNSPLEDAFPGNYPCKQRTGVYEISTMNFMKVGEPQELSFTGSASHGGGTCQLAVSLDMEPTPQSTFKIIQVFEGGCPVNSDGNSGTHPFTFDIPEGFPNGKAVFAWYWNNRIGNREAYMNCAPITVSGGADNLDYYNSLPNLFLANLPSSDCEVPESAALEVPNPGQFVLKDAQASLVQPSGPKCSAYAASQTEGVSGYKSALKSNLAAATAPANGGGSTGAAGNGSPASALGGGSGASAPATTTAQAAAPSGGAGGYGGNSTPATSAAAGGAGAGASPTTLATAISSAPAAPAAPTSAPAAAEPSSYAQTQPSNGAGVAAPSGAAPSGSASTPGGSCSSSSGGIECSSDGSQFGMCTAGGEMIWQPVASGTKCSGGAIVKRDEAEFRNPHVRRHVRHAGSHRAFGFDFS